MQALLVVGGIDPTGGAGITMDVLHAHDAGLWACPVATANTVQTPRRFGAAAPVDPLTFTACLEAAVTSFDIVAVKTGYFADAAQVEYFAAFVRSLLDARPELPIVVDPVAVATAVGDDADARRDVLTAIADKLVPLATVVTPNRAELEQLSDVQVRDLSSGQTAAFRLLGIGAKAVLAKSVARSDERVVDALYQRDTLATFEGQVTHVDVHGGGCALATRLAVHLARGVDVTTAAAISVGELRALRPDARRPKADDPQAVLSPLPLSAGAPDAVRAVEAALAEVLRLLPASWVAECGNNLAYAPAGASGSGEVAVLQQRIRLRGDRPHSPPAAHLAATSHVARVALAAAGVYGSSAAALNLRHEPDVFRSAAAAGLTIGSFDRSGEPAESRSSVEWGTQHVLRQGTVDLVADDGGPGKEPMVRLLARDPEDLVRKLRAMVENRR